MTFDHHLTVWPANLVELDALRLYEETARLEGVEADWGDAPEWVRNIFRTVAQNPYGIRALWNLR